MARNSDDHVGSGAKSKRKGVHAKSKSSKLKSSRIYKKKNRGQGK
jgi:hypothetical protein